MLCWSKLTSSPSPVVARSASLARNDGRRRAQRSASLARTYCPTASARQQHGMHCRCVVCAGRGRNFATAQNPQNNRFLSKLEATKTNGPMLMAEGKYHEYMILVSSSFLIEYMIHLDLWCIQRRTMMFTPLDFVEVSYLLLCRAGTTRTTTLSSSKTSSSK